MGEVEVVVRALRDLGHKNAYARPVSPRVCAEPIVVAPGAFARESLQADGTERGRRTLVAHVCCEDPRDAETTARAVAAQLAARDWADGGDPRVVACDVAQPEYRGRDRSGRWVWDVKLSMTVVVRRG